MASLPVVIAGVVFAVAGGSGAGTTGKDSTHAFGIARASSAAAGAGLASTATPSASFGPHVSNGMHRPAFPGCKK